MRRGRGWWLWEGILPRDILHIHWSHSLGVPLFFAKVGVSGHAATTAFTMGAVLWRTKKTPNLKKKAANPKQEPDFMGKENMVLYKWQVSFVKTKLYSTTLWLYNFFFNMPLFLVNFYINNEGTGLFGATPPTPVTCKTIFRKLSAHLYYLIFGY